MALITCSDLSLSYDGHKVVSDLSFQVNKGDYLCIVGENGSGKSTVIKALLALKKWDSGSMEYGDGLKHNEIGYLPQQTEAQKDFPANVREVVLSGCLNSRGMLPFYSKKNRATAKANMEKLDITDLNRRCYRELSGGQQQRVLLARALCATRKLLLLDEPCAGLDPIVTQDLYHVIKNLNNEGITVVMVSHDITSVVAYASHILHLEKGSSFFGTTNEYMQFPAGKRFIGGC